MIRLWFLVRYFVYFPATNGYWANQNDAIERDKFIWYIVTDKLLFQNIIDTIREFYFRKIQGHYNNETDEVVMERLRRRLKKIDDLIDRAISKNYLVPINKNGYHQNLKIEWQGKNFIKLLPFCEACLKEYGQSVTIIIALLGSGIISVIITNWGNIISYFHSL
ncbi:MAG: hypothetical protein WCW03_01215 [Candidatus Paceibacterota bacterium]|jgi:hypothetical protein